MTPSESEVRAAIAGVEDPELQRGLGELGLVRAVRVQRQSVTVILAVPARRWPGRDGLDPRRVQRAVAALADVGQVVVAFAPMDKEEHGRARAPAGTARPGASLRPPARQAGTDHGAGVAHPGHRDLVGQRGSGQVVGHGQPGRRPGRDRRHEVGLLDADVYGFSVPKMLGVDRGPVAIDELLVPPIVHGVRCMSMGFFVPDEQPVIWRGPMLHKALEQFLVDAYWGEPDYLLIDMPPGTGDVALSLASTCLGPRSSS